MRRSAARRASRRSGCRTPPMRPSLAISRASFASRRRNPNTAPCGVERAAWPRPRTFCSTAASCAPAWCGSAFSTRLNGWLKEEGFGPVVPLLGEDLMHAVARGAAYYGLARAGRGVRIRGGVPRTYYVGIESSMPAVPGMPAPLKALTVAPFGMEEGTSARIARARVRADRGRTRRVPLLSVGGAQERRRRHAAGGRSPRILTSWRRWKSRCRRPVMRASSCRSRWKRS